MKMCKRFLLIALTLSLQGCWFVFIPGGVISAVSDSITGAEGSHCVGANAKVGDTQRLPGGSIGTIKSLSGTSVRCTNPELPIRALLAFSDDTTKTTAPTVSAAASQSSEGGGPVFLTEAQQRLAVGKQVWVSMEPVGLYKDASRESERVERIYKKDALVVEELAGEWLKVQLGSGSRGWIMRNWVGNVQ